MEGEVLAARDKLAGDGKWVVWCEAPWCGAARRGVARCEAPWCEAPWCGAPCVLREWCRVGWGWGEVGSCGLLSPTRGSTGAA